MQVVASPRDQRAPGDLRHDRGGRRDRACCLHV